MNTHGTRYAKTRFKNQNLPTPFWGDNTTETLQIRLRFFIYIHKINEFRPKHSALTFEDRGEVKGFIFKQIEKSDRTYKYEVSNTFGHKGYEVFSHRENGRFDKITHLKSNLFGMWPWTARNLEKANERYNLLQKKQVDISMFIKA